MLAVRSGRIEIQSGPSVSFDSRRTARGSVHIKGIAVMAYESERRAVALRNFPLPR